MAQPAYDRLRHPFYFKNCLAALLSQKLYLLHGFAERLFKARSTCQICADCFCTRFFRRRWALFYQGQMRGGNAKFFRGYRKGYPDKPVSARKHPSYMRVHRTPAEKHPGRRRR